MRRMLNPAANPAGYLAAASAVYAVIEMIRIAYSGHGVIDASVITAAVTAVAALITRQAVTPVADPVSSGGLPLVPGVPPGPAGTPAEQVRQGGGYIQKTYGTPAGPDADPPDGAAVILRKGQENPPHP